MSTVGLSYPKTSEIEYEEFVNIVLKNFKELDWIFSGKLDFKNIQAEGITTKNLHAEAVTAAKILANTITALQIAANAIEADKIKAGAVETDKLAAGAVTAEKIEANTITAAQIAADSITATEIAANAITATEINANAVEADKIKVGAVTADKIDVNQLSAIAADLGTIVAGVIYGAYIATANGTYPRIELSDTANLLTAFKSATKYLVIDADATDPGVFLADGTITSGIFNLLSSQFVINTNKTLSLSASSGNIRASSAAGTITDIVTTINGKANAFSGFTGSFATGTQTVNVVNGIITSVI